MATTRPSPHLHRPTELLTFGSTLHTDMRRSRKHSHKEAIAKPAKPTRYRQRHYSLRDLGESDTKHGFEHRLHVAASPCLSAKAPIYSVWAGSESHSINVTNDNCSAAFSYGEKQIRTTPLRSSPTSASTSTSTSPYSSTFLLRSLSPETTEFEDIGNVYIAPQHPQIYSACTTQNIPEGRFMVSQPAMIHSNSQHPFQPSPLVGDVTDYHEGSFNISPHSGTNSSALSNILFAESGSWQPGATYGSLSEEPNAVLEPNLFEAQQNYYLPFVHSQDVTAIHPPTSTPFPLGGQLYEGLAFGQDTGFIGSELQEFHYPVSNNATDHENLGFYQQQFQNPSNTAHSTNFPTFHGQEFVY